VPRARPAFPDLNAPRVVAADSAVATPRGRLGYVFGLALSGNLGCEGVVRVHGFSSSLDSNWLIRLTGAITSRPTWRAAQG
jgi:hypothetical protein